MTGNVDRMMRPRNALVNENTLKVSEAEAHLSIGLLARTYHINSNSPFLQLPRVARLASVPAGFRITKSPFG